MRLRGIRTVVEGVHRGHGEGVRAVLIDKDQKPTWTPATLEGVSREMVDAHFRPVANDLTFD